MRRPFARAPKGARRPFARASLLALLAAVSLLGFACSAQRDQRLGDTRLSCKTGADCGTGSCVDGQCIESASASVRAIGRAEGADVMVEHQIIGDEVCTPGKQTICTLKPGATVLWRAPHVDGYRFIGWTGDAGCMSDQALLTLQVERDITCTARYVRRLHGSGLVADGQGSVHAASQSPFASCQDGTCEVDQGSEISLTAPARDGYRLTSWQGAGCPSGAGATISITPTVMDVACSAVYAPSLTVRGTAQGAQATISASSDSADAACNVDLCAVQPGETVTLSAPAVDGFRFTGFSGDPSCSSNNAQISISNVISNVSCTASYVARHAVTGASTGASMPLAISATSADAFASCTGATCVVDDGGSVQLLAPTVPGLRLSGWDGEGCMPGNGASASVPSVHQDRTCTARYVAGVAVIGTLIGVDSASGASVDASSTSPGASCAAGRCAIDAGGSVTLTAPDLPGRTFLGWSGDEGCAASARVLTLSAVNTSKSCNARFAERFVASGSGAPENGGSVRAISPAANASCIANRCTVDDGSQVQLVAGASEGFRFAGYSGGGPCTGNAAQLILDAVHNNIACTANFVQRFAITSEVAPAGAGSANVSSASTAASCNGAACTVDAGADAAVFAVPAAGYRFSGWSGCATRADNPLLLTNVRNDQLCRANFARIMLDVSAVASAGGSVRGNVDGADCANADCTVPFGGRVAFSATPAAGYAFAGWSDCLVSTQSDITLDNVTRTQTCRASFTRVQLSVTATSSDGGGIAATSDSGSCANYRCTVDYGGTVVLTAMPAMGFRFVGWDGCSSATSAELTLAKITSNASCNATFTRLQFTVRSSVAPTDAGQVACSSPGCAVAYDGGVTLSATPIDGFVFGRWSGCSTSTNPTLMLTGLRADTSCVANFTRVQHTVTGSVATSGGGSVSCMGGCLFDDGSPAQLTAKPDANYAFASWSCQPSVASTGATLNIASVKQDYACVATFRPTAYTVTAKADSGYTPADNYAGAVCPNNVCTVAPNGTVQLTVTAPRGTAQQTTLLGWDGCTVGDTSVAQVGNNFVYTSSVSRINENLTCTARFGPATLVQSFANPSTGSGNVAVAIPSGAGFCGALTSSSNFCFVLPGKSATFTASPDTASSWYLSNWECHNLQVPLADPNTQRPNNPLASGPLTTGGSADCTANFAQIIVQ